MAARDERELVDACLLLGAVASSVDEAVPAPWRVSAADREIRLSREQEEPSFTIQVSAAFLASPLDAHADLERCLEALQDELQIQLTEQWPLGEAARPEVVVRDGDLVVTWVGSSRHWHVGAFPI